MSKLSEQSVPLPGLPGWRSVHLETVTSTNQVLAEAARAGEQGRLWLTAGEQTSGRGRRGRPWSSPRENLYASVLLTDFPDAEQLGTLPFVVALAVHDMAACVLPGDVARSLQIKWPNDLLIGTAKCAGLLIETAQTPDGKLAVIAGFGVNVGSFPHDTPYAATCLRDHACHCSLSNLFVTLAGHLAQRLDLWDHGRNFASVRTAWLERAAGLGSVITVNLPHMSMHGLFEAVDDCGRLILKLPDGKKELISAGDVFL